MIISVNRTMSRREISPPLSSTFDQVYEMILAHAGARTPKLLTTGGVPFEAAAKMTLDGRRFIFLPHNNRIYEHDWGHATNAMGRDGQRIGHYSVPLDEWTKGINKRSPSREPGTA